MALCVSAVVCWLHCCVNPFFCLYFAERLWVVVQFIQFVKDVMLIVVELLHVCYLCSCWSYPF